MNESSVEYHCPNCGRISESAGDGCHQCGWGYLDQDDDRLNAEQRAQFAKTQAELARVAAGDYDMDEADLYRLGALQDAYVAKWPNYCHKCWGRGFKEHLAFGYWEQDSCPDCIEKGTCPRCGQADAVPWDDEVQIFLPCTKCAWNPDGRDGGMPVDG